MQARVRVTLRHAMRGDQASPDPTLTIGDLQLDLVGRRVLRRGEEIHLTPIEYKLLTTPARHIDKVLTQRHLLKEVWGPAYETETHYLRVYMGQLRHKLEDDPTRPRHLITEPGVGYRLRSN